MNTSTPCPSCTGRLTLWHGFRAVTPFRIRCPHCREQLRVRLRGLTPVFWFVVVMALAVGGFLGFLQVMGRDLTTGFLIAGLIGVWIFVEVVTGIILYTFAEFSVLQSTPPKEQRSA